MNASLSSAGLQPNAVSFSQVMLYVWNVGSAANSFASNIKGFSVAADGSLSRIAGATYSLRTSDAQPPGAQFNAAGVLLAVREISTGNMSGFPVDCAGTLGVPTVNAPPAERRSTPVSRHPLSTFKGLS